MKTAKDLKIPFVWEDRRPILLERFFYIPASYDYKEEKISFFEDEKPIAIEYCSGNGQWILEKAKQNPHINWIAVEKKFERARKVWLGIFRNQLPNLCVVCGTAEVFTQFYAPTALDAYVNFPDPWPKLRHAKHRLIQEAFLKQVARVVHGKMICVTDDLPYAEQMQAEFAKCAEWKNLFYKHEMEEFGDSFFKDLWESKGRRIHYLCYTANDSSIRNRQEAAPDLDQALAGAEAARLELSRAMQADLESGGKATRPKPRIEL